MKMISIEVSVDSAVNNADSRYQMYNFSQVYE